MSADKQPDPGIFLPTTAVGPRFSAASGDFTVSTNWKRGDGVNIVVKCTAEEFTLNEATQIRDSLTDLIQQIERSLQ